MKKEIFGIIAAVIIFSFGLFYSCTQDSFMERQGIDSKIENVIDDTIKVEPKGDPICGTKISLDSIKRKGDPICGTKK